MESTSDLSRNAGHFVFLVPFGSLGAVGSLLEDFLEPFGNLGGDFEKTFQKLS